MTIRHLKIFITVCELGSITRTAEAMHITQPAISHTIAELEKYYDITLFERINQRLVLTELGKQALRRAREITEAFDSFEEFVSHGNQDPTVRIGCSLTLGQTIIPKFMKLLQSHHPNIKPKIIIKPSATLEEELESGNLDFAIVEGEVSSPYLSIEHFMEDRILIVANTDLCVPDILTPEILPSLPFLLRERGSASRECFERAIAKYHLRIEPTIESANNQAIVAALYANLGIAILPESFVVGHIERRRFKTLTLDGFDANGTNYIIIHKNKKLNSTGTIAYEILKNINSIE